jgi:hypothetical protein
MENNFSLTQQLNKFTDSFQTAFAEDREDWAKINRVDRESRGSTPDGPKFSLMAATYPTSVRIRENLGTANKQSAQLRETMGMGLEKGPTRRAGQMLGTLAADVVDDKGRSFWWLLNALQATGGVVAEQAIGKALPELYEQAPVLDDAGMQIPVQNQSKALEMGMIAQLPNGDTVTKPGIRTNNGVYTRPKYSGGMRTAATLLPTGIAINAGMGLLTPTGGAEGYKAVLPSEDDPTKTSNVIGEVALKYLLGRRGDLLPYDEFKKVRPDVSEDEYRRYKAYRYDRRTDLNPLDGDFNIGGVVKGTTEGINGPELQLLGGSAPLIGTGIPFATSIAGAVAGGRLGRGSNRSAMGALLGGLTGTGAGMGVASLVEDERRRRNQQENMG